MMMVNDPTVLERLISRTNRRINLIGISGKIGTGKSSIAARIHSLLSTTRYSTHVSFGGMVKEEASRLFSIPIEKFYHSKGEEVTFTNPLSGKQETKTIRELLQWFGTDYCQAMYGRNVWVKRLHEHLQSVVTDFAIIDDVRFPHEAQYIIDQKGVLIRILPHSGWEPTAFANHISETALDAYANWDLVYQPECDPFCVINIAESICYHVVAQPPYLVFSRSRDPR